MISGKTIVAITMGEGESEYTVCTNTSNCSELLLRHVPNSPDTWVDVLDKNGEIRSSLNVRYISSVCYAP